jgi:hypothetical protein
LGGGSFLNTATTATNGGFAGSYGNPNSPQQPSDFGIWLPLLVMLALISAAIWICMKVARNGEAPQNEVPYQNLDTEQILGKILEK